jgi:hypothetical protein
MNHYIIAKDVCLIIIQFIGTDIITKQAERLFGDPSSDSDNLNRLNISYDIFQSFPRRIIHNVIAFNPYVSIKWFFHDRLYDFILSDTYPIVSLDNTSWEHMGRSNIIRRLTKIKQCSKCQTNTCIKSWHCINWDQLHNNASIPIQYIKSNFPGCIMWNKLPRCYELDVIMRCGLQKITLAEWKLLRNNPNVFPSFVHIKNRSISPEEKILLDYNTKYILRRFGHIV